MVERAGHEPIQPHAEPHTRETRGPDFFETAKSAVINLIRPLLGSHGGNPGEFEEGVRIDQHHAAGKIQNLGRGFLQRKKLSRVNQHSLRTSPVSQPETEAAALESEEHFKELQAQLFASEAETRTTIGSQMGSALEKMRSLQTEAYRQLVTHNTGRSFEIDRMLNELSTHNRSKAIEAAEKAADNWNEGANLFRLLLEHETRTGTQIDPRLHDMARNWLVRYVSAHSSLIRGGNLTLSPDAYSVYEHLKREPISSHESIALERSINFIRPGVSTEGAIAALGRAAIDYARVPRLPLPAPRYRDGPTVLSSHVRVPVSAPKTDEDFDKLTFGIAYLATTQSLNPTDPTCSKFIASISNIAKRLQEKDTLSQAEQTFLSVQRVLGYRLILGADCVSRIDRPVFLGSIGIGTTNADVEKRLQNIKSQYFATNYPFSAQDLHVTKGQEAGKIQLSSTEPFEKQMQDLGIDWQLSDIIKLATTEGLPDSFLNRFSDHGISLYRDHIYPALIASHPGAASAEQLEKLLRPDALNKQRSEFWRDTIRFISEDLKGSPIRSDQVENMLNKLMEVTSKQVYIIQAAGAGKSTMARYCARVLLRDAQFVLFASPFNEPRTSVQKLTSLEQLIGARPINGKPPEFHVTAEEYDALLREAKPEQIRALKFGLHILDEFDSEDYGTARELLVKAGVSRVANMSASDDDLKLLNKLERKKFKLDSGAEPGEKTDLWLARKAALEKDIKEIQANIELEFSRPITLTRENFEPKSISAGQVALVLHPDEQDADALAKIYQQQLPKNGIVIYRDNSGQRMVLTSKGSRYNYEAFLGLYDKLTPKPSVICLYTKDSRGGDFERFSRQNAGQDHIVSQHIFYKKPKPRNEIYQNLRRLRGTERNSVPVSIHYSGPEKFESWESLQASSNNLQQVRSQKDESVRLTDKIQRKMRKFVESALNAKWAEISQEHLKPFWTKETYKEAVSEVLSSWNFQNRNAVEEYRDIHAAVIKNFISKVNTSVQTSATKDLETQVSILQELSPKALWSSRNSITQRPKEGTSLKALWSAHLSKQGLTSGQINSLTTRVFPKDAKLLDAKFQNSMFAGNLSPGLVQTTFDENRFRKITQELQEEIAQTKTRSDAMSRLQQIAPKALSEQDMPELTRKALQDVVFYQEQLARIKVSV